MSWAYGTKKLSFAWEFEPQLVLISHADTLSITKNSLASKFKLNFTFGKYIDRIQSILCGYLLVRMFWWKTDILVLITKYNFLIKRWEKSLTIIETLWFPEWPLGDHSKQYRYNVNQNGDGKKVRYQQREIAWSYFTFSELIL